MLVKFESEVGSVTMFGDIAVTLLKMMGHSGTVPSALLAKDIPAAAGQLKSALSMTADSDATPATPSEEGEGSRVSLRKRAFPLVELMDRAAARGVDITWA
jgi:hypothetical protein